MSYDELARNWYQRALKEKDDFVRFIIFYISLEAIMKQRNERIINLKTNDVVKKAFFQTISQESLLKLKDELDKQPLINMRPRRIHEWSGKFSSTNDFNDIIEFIIRARNNLFHGDKDPSIDRDQFIVKWGNTLLEPILKEIII